MSTPTVAPWTTLVMQLASLNVLFDYVQARNALAFVPSETKVANNDNLKSIRGYLERLSVTGDLGRKVWEGGDASTWVKVANQQGEGLNGILQTLKEENYAGRAWKEIVVPTAQQLGEQVQEVGTGTGIGIGIVLALVAVLYFARGR